MEVIFGEDHGVRVSRMDEKGNGGAHHHYSLTDVKCKELFGAVDFQDGPVGEVGLKGCQNEDLLAIVIDRLECFQAGPFKCDENHFALGFVKKAVDCLEQRTADRRERGVEGKNEA